MMGKIHNPQIQAMMEPLLVLDPKEVRWRLDRWQDYLEKAPLSEVEHLHQQLLSEIEHFEGDIGPPLAPSAEYTLLMSLYQVTTYVGDMHSLGMH